MKLRPWKVILGIVCIPALLVIGAWGMLVTIFLEGQKFYQPLVIVCIGALIIFALLWAFELFQTKVRVIAFVSLLAVCVIAVTGYELNRNYNQSIQTMNEQGVNLELYSPFGENTKAVRLKEAPALRIAENLPRLDGATALYPLYAAFAQALYPEKNYETYHSEVMCNTTPEAYDNLIRGQADIIFCARPSKQQLEDAKKQGVVLKLTPIGREAFVFFGNFKNPVRNLSTRQIQNIYSGKIRNWKEVGGKNESIKAFQRPENSGSQTMLQKLMAGKGLMTPPKEDVVLGMGGIIEETANYRNYKNAIGFSFLFFATEMVKNEQIRLLSIDGIFPDRTTIRSKTYPLGAEFYAITAGSKNPNLNQLIEWILSPQGQYLVEKTGYTPL